MDLYQRLAQRDKQSVGIRFATRIPELLKIEGWYSIPYLFDKRGNNRKIKLSCRWKDILRASDSKHFRSCFSFNGCYKEQPILRLQNPNWAVIIMLDESGDVAARAYCELIKNGTNRNKLLVSRVYGNYLTLVLIETALYNIARVEGREDIYLGK